MPRTAGLWIALAATMLPGCTLFGRFYTGYYAGCEAASENWSPALVIADSLAAESGGTVRIFFIRVGGRYLDSATFSKQPPDFVGLRETGSPEEPLVVSMGIGSENIEILDRGRAVMVEVDRSGGSEDEVMRALRKRIERALEKARCQTWTVKQGTYQPYLPGP